MPLETAEAQQLTQEYAAQSKSTVLSPPLNGDCFPTIVEKIEENSSCKDLTVVERVQTKRLRIVDRVRQNKLRVLEKNFMEQASTVHKEPNLETRAFLYAEVERARQCASHAHAHVPLNPAAFAFVPFGIVLARIRVQIPPESSQVKCLIPISH